MIWFITDGEIAYEVAIFLADTFGIDEDNLDKMPIISYYEFSSILISVFLIFLIPTNDESK